MKLQYNLSDEIVFIDKPAGISTHSPDPGKLGLAELFEREILLANGKLHAIHPLDKETSGCIAFAKNSEVAAKTFELFQEHRVQQKYWFLTDRKSTEMEYQHRSLIEKLQGKWHSDPVGASNSETHFTRIKRSPFFELWEAKPVTGKPRQIRLHAQDLGLPILGDTLHGGSSFPHLCLHSQSLLIPGHPELTRTPPRFFERLGLLKNSELCHWISEVDRRQRLFDFLKQPEQCLRLVHLNNLFVDQLGEILWCQWQKADAPTAAELGALEFLACLLGNRMLVRKTANRGQDPLLKKEWSLGGAVPESWTAREGSLTFSFSRTRGLSAGLFLDQKNNREWVQNNSQELDVLNLFSYTCGFGVAAAVGGAKQVSNVDVSRDFLTWGQENFVHNGLDPARHEFFMQDSILFLKACRKKERKFDLVICDPPTFGRHKGGTFSLEKDFALLLDLCASSLRPNGKLMFCCNYEKWDLEFLENFIRKSQTWKLLPAPAPAWDYELPNQPRLMKTLLLCQQSDHSERKSFEKNDSNGNGKNYSRPARTTRR